jgi:hypothetical protein
MGQDSTESYGHKCAKDLLATWIKEDAASGTIKFISADGSPLIMREIAGPTEVYTEYPLDGGDKSWSARSEKWAVKIPTRDDIKNINAIADIAVVSNGKIVLVVEIVHTHDLTDSKANFLSRQSFPTVSVFSDRVMDQVSKPEMYPCFSCLNWVSPKPLLRLATSEAVKNVVDELLDEIEDRRQGAHRNIQCSMISSMVQEFRPGSLTVIAGLPGSGRRSFISSVISENADNSYLAVLHASQTSKDMLSRIMSIRACLPTSEFSNGRSKEETLEQIACLAKAACEWKVSFLDISAFTVPRAFELILSLSKTNSRPGAIIIDDVSLLKRVQASFDGDVFVMLKNAAMATGIPIICGAPAQLPDPKYGAGSKLSLLHSVKYLGLVGEVADVIIFLQSNGDKECTNIIQLMMLRNRIGPAGNISAQFNAKTGVFSPYAPAPDDDDDVGLYRTSRKPRSQVAPSSNEDLFA